MVKDKQNGKYMMKLIFESVHQSDKSDSTDPWLASVLRNCMASFWLLCKNDLPDTCTPKILEENVNLTLEILEGENVRVEIFWNP